MCLLPGNPFTQAVEAYRDSGEALCSKGMHVVPPPVEPPNTTLVTFPAPPQPTTCSRSWPGGSNHTLGAVRPDVSG